jgi:archaellum biogenesis protein FlaJ (TadC family)
LAFNEFKENQLALVVSTVLFFIDIVLVMMFYSENAFVRLAVWVCNVGASNALLWATLGKPVFG